MTSKSLYLCFFLSEIAPVVLSSARATLLIVRGLAPSGQMDLLEHKYYSAKERFPQIANPFLTQDKPLFPLGLSR